MATEEMPAGPQANEPPEATLDKKWFQKIWTRDWQWGVLPRKEGKRGRIGWLMRIIMIATLTATAFVVWGYPGEAAYHHPWFVRLMVGVWIMGTMRLILSVLKRGSDKSQYRHIRGFNYFHERGRYRKGVIGWLVYKVLPSDFKGDLHARHSLVVYGILFALWGGMEWRHSLDHNDPVGHRFVSKEEVRQRRERDYQNQRYWRREEEQQDKWRAHQWQEAKTFVKTNAMKPEIQLAAWIVTLLLFGGLVRLRWRRRFHNAIETLEATHDGQRNEWEIQEYKLKDAMKAERVLLWEIVQQIAVGAELLGRDRRRGDKEIGAVRVRLESLVEKAYPGDECQGTRDRLKGMAMRIIHEEARKASEPKPPDNAKPN